MVVAGAQIFGSGNLGDTVVTVLCSGKRLKFWSCPGRAHPTFGSSLLLTFAFSKPAAPLKAHSWWALRENREVAGGGEVIELRLN